MNNCTTGIKNAVSKYVEDKPYLRFDGINFIQVTSSPQEKVNTTNFFSVATRVANTLNKAINSSLTLGKVFYPISNSGITGVQISPTDKQLSLLNAKDQEDTNEALKELEKETPLKDRIDLENNTSFNVNKEGDSNIFYQIANEQPSKNIDREKLGIDTRKSLFLLSNNMRRANMAFEMLGDKNKIAVNTTANMLIENNPLKYIYVQKNGIIQILIDELSKDIYKELGDKIVPQKALDEAEAFRKAMDDETGIQESIDNYKDRLSTEIKKYQETIDNINLENKSEKELFDILLNTNTNSFYWDSKHIYRHFILRGRDNNIYNFSYDNGALKSISKQYKKPSRIDGYISTGYDNISKENEDEWINANLALQEFKKSGDRIKVAINKLIIEDLQNQTKRTEKLLNDENLESDYIRNTLDLRRESTQMSEHDFIEYGVESMVKNNLIANGIITEDNQITKPFGFTSDKLLKLSNDRSYESALDRQNKIKEIIANKSKYNNEYDDFEEDGDILAPIPGWWLNAVSVMNYGKLFDEHRGFSSGLIKGVIHLDSKKQYDDFIDGGKTPDFQKLIDTKDINSLLPAGIKYGTPIDLSDRTYLLNQLENNTISSTASPKTISIIKDFLKRIGVDIKGGEKIIVNGKKLDANAIANITQQLIQVVDGKESQSLPEEAMHFAVEIIEQTNPKLFNQLLKEINSYNILKDVFADYSTNPNYQINGKPDVRKLKKEAIGKVLAESVIKKNEGLTEKPELLAKVESWWETILNYLKGIFSKSGFDTLSMNIIRGESIGTIEAIKISPKENIFLQSAQNEGLEEQLEEAKKLVDEFYNKVEDMSKRIGGPFPEVLEDGKVKKKRHYTFDGEDVGRSVTEKTKMNAAKKMPDRTDSQKIDDVAMRDWGLEGHAFIQNYITTNLTDENGYARKEFLDIPIDSKLPEGIQMQLKKFAKELISSYAEGTRFLIEKKIINLKEKGMLASTVDFKAIEPVIINGKPDIRIDTLDWKFTNFDKTHNEDLPWYKRTEWKSQMGEYTKIDYQYGATPKQVRKARMVPFIANYDYMLPGDRKSGLALVSLEVGKVNSLQETNLYLLPVAINSETTNNTLIDDLLSSLNKEYEKLYKKVVGEDEKIVKYAKLEAISKAIRFLHIKLDFGPLVNVGKSFIKSTASSIKKLEIIDWAKLSLEEINKLSLDLLEYEATAKKYTSLDETYLSHISAEDMSEEEQNVYKSLRGISKSSQELLKEILGIQHEIAVEVALREKITTENTKLSVLDAERSIDFLSKSFLEGSKLNPKLIQLASNMLETAAGEVQQETASLVNKFTKVLIPLIEEAKTKGKKAFSLIGSVENNSLSLIKKIDRKFWDEVKDAKKNKDKKFFIKNMDIEEYNKFVKEAIEKTTREAEFLFTSSNEEEADRQKSSRITRIKNLLDINRKNFNGWNHPQFNYYFNRSMKEHLHYSEEYKNMSENALKVWEFFTSLNDRAKKSGYIGKQGMAFFALIEATMLEKIAQTNKIVEQSKDFWRDLYSVKTEEEQTYAKTNPETGKIKREIPKRYTRTNKNVEQLSQDLNRVGILFIKSLLKYESSKNIEGILLTLHQVEKNKGSLIIENGEIVIERGVPRVDRDSNSNATQLETIINDGLYEIVEDLSSLGNISVGAISDKLSNDKETSEKRTLATKKTLKNANTLFRTLALGLKPLLGIANWAGGQFQAYINAGNVGTFGEFTRNNIRVMSTSLSTIEKALLDMIVPLTNDITEEKIRQTAKKISYKDYLGAWTFNDVMMSTNSYPERQLQYANALTFLENSMVKGDEIVNIRQFIKEEDRRKREQGISFQERKELENSYEKRVKELKESSSLIKIAKIENDETIIPRVSKRNIAKFRTKIIEYNRNLSGLMNPDNKAGYTRDSIFTSFMMFRGWIPKQVSVRTIGIRKNIELDEWEYGRSRAFVKLMVHLGLKNISSLRDIIIGNDKGLQILNDILEQKRLDYFNKTGQILEITNEEFYDLMRTQIANQFKELGLLIGLLSLAFTAKAMQPPDDEDILTKNRWKWIVKGMNKISNEVDFYYNPLSADSITRGSIIPSLGLLTKAEQAINNIGEQTYGYVTDNDVLQDDAHPLKYTLNLLPIGSQFQTEILPYLYPELAKEMGIRVTPQARIGQ